MKIRTGRFFFPRLRAICLLFFIGLTGCRTLITVGAVEMVVIEEINVLSEARIDTGAELCSLGVDFVAVAADGKFVFFEYDGNRYCLPLQRTVAVRTVNGTVSRPTVELTARIGAGEKRCEWTLSDRNGMRYGVLVGRNWLTDTALVDVSSGIRHNRKSGEVPEKEEDCVTESYRNR